MSEISGGSNDSIEFDGAGEVSLSGSENEVMSSNTPSIEMATSTPSSETVSGGNVESMSAPSSEIITIDPNSAPYGLNQILVTPEMLAPQTMEQAQKELESYQNQSISQIIAMNGKYMSEADKARVQAGVNRSSAVWLEPNSEWIGRHSVKNGYSEIEVGIMDRLHMQQTVLHELNHHASTNKEVYVPQPEKNGYAYYQSVGTRQIGIFHSFDTGEDSLIFDRGSGLNEGLTSMYTSQQLSEMGDEQALIADQQEFYSTAKEICGQLENIVGEDTLKEAYYGGNMQGLEAKVDSLAGEKEFEALRDCIDRTISEDQAIREQAAREAQDILEKMYEEGSKKA